MTGRHTEDNGPRPMHCGAYTARRHDAQVR